MSKKNRPYHKSGITAEQFVTAWAKSKTLNDFKRLTGISPINACQRASKYRKRGVKLPKLTQWKREKLNVAALNRILQGLA